MTVSKKFFCIFYSIFIIFSFSLNAQELEPTVEVNLDRLSIDVRDRLSSFKQEVTDYLSKTRFTDEIIVNDLKGKPYKIRCTFNIAFNSSSGFDSYDAAVIVTAQRYIFRTPDFSQLLKIKDEKWQFTYLKGQKFYHDPLRFNSLTSFLDYYAYLIIGMDDDSWELELGSSRFQMAQDVVNLALASGSTSGWTEVSGLKPSRSAYPLELLNSKYDDFRKAFWLYHFSGIDSLKSFRSQALDRIARAIDLIGKVKKTEIRSFSIRMFFETKYLEIAQVMVDYYDKSIYRKLGEIDPDHLSTYEEYRLK
jgi:hypothetical protein